MATSALVSQLWTHTSLPVTCPTPQYSPWSQDSGVRTSVGSLQKRTLCCIIASHPTVMLYTVWMVRTRESVYLELTSKASCGGCWTCMPIVRVSSCSIVKHCDPCQQHCYPAGWLYDMIQIQSNIKCFDGNKLTKVKLVAIHLCQQQLKTLENWPKKSLWIELWSKMVVTSQEDKRRWQSSLKSTRLQLGSSQVGMWAGSSHRSTW